MLHTRVAKIVLLLFLATVLTSCFGSSAGFHGVPQAAGGRTAVTGRLAVDLESEIPAVPAVATDRRTRAGLVSVRRQGTWLDPSPVRPLPLGGEERFWLLARPNDPLLHEQWNLDLIRLPEAWALLADEGAVTAPVRVALVDTRVCADHEDLLPADRWIAFDLIEGDHRRALECPPAGTGSDAYHGTLVAGFFASVGNNGRGIVPAGWVGFPYVEPVAVRALDDFGLGTARRVAEGIRTAVYEGGARVVNLSVGTMFNDALDGDRRAKEELYAAVDEAVAAGALVVAAAGNWGRPGLASPADHPRVLAVGATGARGEWAEYSNTGDVDLVSPGGGRCPSPTSLISTGGTNQYWCTTGTSMAAPQVTATAALLMALGVETAEEVAEILRFTARSIGEAGGGTGLLYDKVREGHSDRYGWGMLDVAGAVRLRAVPRVFVARVGEERIEAVSPGVRPAPSGWFSLSVDGGGGEVYLVGWADSDRDGRLSPGDFYAELPLSVTGRNVDVGVLTASPYGGSPREVTGLGGP